MEGKGAGAFQSRCESVLTPDDIFKGHLMLFYCGAFGGVFDLGFHMKIRICREQAC